MECRVGNHAFAKDYNATVPDSFAVINGAHPVVPLQAGLGCTLHYGQCSLPARFRNLCPCVSTGQDVVTHGAKFGKKPLTLHSSV